MIALIQVTESIFISTISVYNYEAILKKHQSLKSSICHEAGLVGYLTKLRKGLHAAVHTFHSTVFSQQLNREAFSG
jgi:hypothetical protein